MWYVWSTLNFWKAYKFKPVSCTYILGKHCPKMIHFLAPLSHKGRYHGRYHAPHCWHADCYTLYCITNCFFPPNACLISSFFWCLGCDKSHLLLRNAWQIILSDCCHHRCYFVQFQKTFLKVWNYKEDFVIPAAGRTSAHSLLFKTP